jgi:hypothetical protein
MLTHQSNSTFKKYDSHFKYLPKAASGIANTNIGANAPSLPVDNRRPIQLRRFDTGERRLKF